MAKRFKLKNSNGDNFLKYKNFIPNFIEKFDDYYSDVYKEGVLDYPIAFFSALIRISLPRNF